MKKQLLDPLGTLCKLVALNFSESNTKISIHNHVLTLHRPNNLQFAVRLINGDSKENVSEIYYAIIRIIKWYLVPYYDKNNKGSDNNSIGSNKSDKSSKSPKSSKLDESTINIDNINYKEDSMVVDANPNLLYEDIDNTDNINLPNWMNISKSKELPRILKYACDALRTLQGTYGYGNVVLAIQYYINLIEDGLKGIYDDSKLPKYILDQEIEIANLLDYEKLRNFWDFKKLKRICELYDNCFMVLSDQEIGQAKRML